MEGATVLRLGGVRARRRGQGYGNLISKPRSDKRQFSGVLGYNAGRGVYKEVKGGRDKGRRLRRLAVAARDEAQIPNRPRRVASRACRVAFPRPASVGVPHVYWHYSSHIEVYAVCLLTYISSAIVTK